MSRYIGGSLEQMLTRRFQQVFLKKQPHRSSQEWRAGQKEKRIPNKKSIEAIEMRVYDVLYPEPKKQMRNEKVVGGADHRGALNKMLCDHVSGRSLW